MTPADPTLNALLVANATEDWPAWYGCTRLAVADYLEDRGLADDWLSAPWVRGLRPWAWGQVAVPPGWEAAEVSLARNAPPAPDPAWLRIFIDGCPGDGTRWTLLTDDHRYPASGGLVDGPCLRPFPLRALRVGAVITDGSEVSAGVLLRQPGYPIHGRHDLKLTCWDARLWCRREVLGLFPDVLVKAPCLHCGGKGAVSPPGALADGSARRGVPRLKHGPLGLPGRIRCPVCRGRPPRPRPAPSLLPALPAVALPAPAPLN